MLTQEQVKQRRSYIGASEAAAVLGLSRWSSPLEIWAIKTGAIIPEDISGKLSVRLGNKLEQTVAELFMEETGKKVQRVNETVFHPKYPFLGANLDRKVVGERAVLEVKTASGWKAKEWSEDEFPQEYVLQVLHQLAVTGYEKGYLAVLIGGNQDFKIKEIQRDEKVINDLVKRLVEFWQNFVVPSVMPSVCSHDRTTLSALFPEAHEGKEIELPADAIAICESLEGLEEDLKSVERQVEKQKNELRQMMRDAEKGVAGDWIIRWSNFKSKRLDMDRLKEEAPEVLDKYYKMTTTRRFLVGKTNTNGGN